MDEEHGYLLQLLHNAWESTEEGAFVIDLFVGLFLVVVVRNLEKRNRLPSILIPITKHKIFEDDKLRMLLACLLVFLLQVVFVSPYSIFQKTQTTIKHLQKEVDDKTPKLDGFVHRIFMSSEPNTTNTLLFVEMTVDNSGGSPSYADSYGLRVISTKNPSVEAEPIKITDEYKFNFIHDAKLWLLDLKRSQLIAEKTLDAIPIGEPKRGWTGFRLRGLPIGSFQETNLVASFSDDTGKTILVTNGFWKGSLQTLTQIDDLISDEPGAENIFYPIVTEPRTGWLPPELPPDCTNVVVVFGTSFVTYSRFMASIDPETGTRFNIADVPDFFLSGIESNPNYSPMQPDIFLKYGENLNFGGKTVSYPIHPVIVSNRLYVEVEVPFSNEKHKLVMNNSFDSELSLPRHWDRNYSTNYDETHGVFNYEIVNELQNPVMQVAYAAPNVVIVNGIFQVDSNTILAAFGDMPRLLTLRLTGESTTNGTITASLDADTFHEELIIHSNETIATFGQRLTNEFFRPIFKNQRPIFKYPSNRHPGALADWLLETNKSVTKFSDKPH